MSAGQRNLLALLIIVVGSISGQVIESHTIYQESPPGSFRFGLYGYDNPAMLVYLHQPDIFFTYLDEDDTIGFNDYGLFIGLPNIGFGMIKDDTISDYRFSTGIGNKRMGLGIGYGWSDRKGEKIRNLTLGYLYRPSRYLSFGINSSFSLNTGDRGLVADIGIRPFGNERLTLFGDYPLKKGIELKDANWSAGMVLEFLPGFRFITRYFSDKSVNLGFNFSLGRIGFVAHSHFDEEFETKHRTYGVRLGAYDRNLFKGLFEAKRNYLELIWDGPVKYQRYLLFDKGKKFLSLIKTIDIAKKDPTIKGIALSLSGIEINKELAWELREKLKDFKSVGKKVVVYIDDVDIFGYYFASIGDKIVLDPLGSITLPGLLMGKMYFKGALDKLGIGVDEWRYFKYKSAAEVLSRDKMSDADREQLQTIIDDIYEWIKSDICSARNFAPKQFDELVNQGWVFTPDTALKIGLVDTIGRWDEVRELIKSIEGRKKRFISSQMLSYYQMPKDNYWGERPKIAIIYGLGVCAMDTGIKARSLVKDIEWATEKKDILAVVFRVDSPGGSALASDIVAEALKKCQKKKPVIVSQGYVAGSGGYWLSMYGDTIVSSPLTITGSIGVIGLWLYNKELKERIGFSTDFVKKGEHADLNFGFIFPLLGQLPDRNLTEEEKAKMEKLIKLLYKEFVEKVAGARNMKPEEIEEIAQGRVWSGYRAKEIGLVDTLGGIETAIKIARKKAGIPEWMEIEIIELPKPQLIPPDLFQPRLLGTRDDIKRFNEYFNFMVEHNGEILHIMPLDYVFTTSNR